MAVSLRDQLNSMGIDGHKCEQLLREYLELVRMYPAITIGLFLQQVKDTVHVA